MVFNAFQTVSMVFEGFISPFDEFISNKFARFSIILSLLLDTFITCEIKIISILLIFKDGYSITDKTFSSIFKLLMFSGVFEFEGK